MKKLITLLLVLTGMVTSAKATWYILGDNSELGDWKPQNAKEMTESNGIHYYSFTASESDTFYFCFSEARPSTEDWEIFNGSCCRPTATQVLGFGGRIAVTHTNSGDLSYGVSLENGTSYLVAFDPTNYIITVTYLPTSINIIGGASGWHTNSGTLMTHSSDYVYTCDLNISEGNTTFAFTTYLSDSDSDWTGISKYRFGAASSSCNYLISSFPNNDINLGWGSDDNHTFSISTPGVYEVTLDYKQLKLSIDKKTESVTTNSKGFCTYVNTNPLKIEGATAYYATDNNNGSALATSVSTPAAGTAMLIKGNENTTYKFHVAVSGTEIDPNSNAFKAGPGSAVASTDGSLHNYILSGNAFYQAGGKTVPTTKAYLQLSQAAAARPLIFDFENETTGIENTVKSEETKDKSFFNLAGQRVAQPSKGLYIMNGRKVVIK